MGFYMTFSDSFIVGYPYNWQWGDQPQMGYLYITPSPHLRDYQGRWGRKAENQKSAGTRVQQCLLDTAGLLHS